MKIKDEYYTFIENTGEEFWFNSIKERSAHADSLIKGEKHNDLPQYIRCHLSDGYATRVENIFHRVIQYNGKRYYSFKKLIGGARIDIYSKCKHSLDINFELGVHDFPLGKDFDYSNPDVKIIEEWLTGAQLISPFRDPDYASSQMKYIRWN